MAEGLRREGQVRAGLLWPLQSPRMDESLRGNRHGGRPAPAP